MISNTRSFLFLFSVLKKILNYTFTKFIFALDEKYFLCYNLSCVFICFNMEKMK